MRKPTSFVFAADIHGSEQDPVTMRGLRSFVEDFKPEVRFAGGDIWEFACLRKGASEEEQMTPLDRDWQMGEDFLSWFFRGGQENHLFWGNHDVRLYDLLKSPKAAIVDYGKDGIATVKNLARLHNAREWEYNTKTGVYERGHFKCCHGYGKGGAGTWREHASAYGTCLFGHCHTIGSHTLSNWKGPQVADSVGCCCRTDMTYMQRAMAVMKWENGWGYGWFFPDGTYQLNKTRRIGDQFHATTVIKTYGDLGLVAPECAIIEGEETVGAGMEDCQGDM